MPAHKLEDEMLKFILIAVLVLFAAALVVVYVYAVRDFATDGRWFEYMIQHHSPLLFSP